MRVLFYHSLAIRLRLHFFATCLLVHIIAIVRAGIVFLRSVVEVGLLVSISIFRYSQRYFKISTKAVDHVFLLVSFMLYLFLQQLLMRITFLNRIYYMAR